MTDQLAEVASAARRGIASLETLLAERRTDSVSILDVIVTLDAEDLVVEAIGEDGESIVPITRVSRDAPGDAAKIALVNAVTRAISRAIETGETSR